MLVLFVTVSLLFYVLVFWPRGMWDLGASLVVQMVKNLPANVGDAASIPDPGRSHMLQSSRACALESGSHNS